MAGSATVTGKQHYILGIGHPQNQASTEGAPAVFSENGQIIIGPDGVFKSYIEIAESELSTTQGVDGLIYSLSDGDNAGAKLTWAIPNGATTETWCWWLWPQAAFE